MQLTRLLGSAENRGSGCYRSPAIHGRLREPVNELNARFGTRDDNPRLPLHLRLAALAFVERETARLV
jgi:hypothetical protein